MLMCCSFVCVFFFKQKTAYEMRISDWSSDVCSSDLYDDLRAAMPEVEIVEVPAARVSLADAVSSYLFNAQLVSLPTGEQALVLPEEARANADRKSTRLNSSH